MFYGGKSAHFISFRPITPLSFTYNFFTTLSEYFGYFLLPLYIFLLDFGSFSHLAFCALSLRSCDIYISYTSNLTYINFKENLGSLCEYEVEEGHSKLEQLEGGKSKKIKGK